MAILRTNSWIRWPVIAALAGLAAVLFLRPTGPAGANAGNILRTLNTTPVFCTPSISSPAIGVAFDGADLMISCTTSNVITLVSPINGSTVGTISVTGIPESEGIAALSWDAKDNLLWAGTAKAVPQKVYTILVDKPSGTAIATYRFSQTLGVWPIIDGLAYDGYDDTLWLGADISGAIYHYSLDGALLGSLDVSSSLGGFGNSGIAVANGTLLYVGNDGGGQIYTARKSGTPATKKGSVVTFFASLSGKRVEDLECDNVTFAPKSVLWSKDAYDSELNAFEVPAQCLQGGIPEPPIANTGTRMTGGGSVFTSAGARVTHGFELHCNTQKAPNNLEINWEASNSFHLEKLVSASCTDDPAIGPAPPAAGFDTYTGKGTGRLNGVPLGSAEWTFTDAGEPGRDDTVSIVVKDPAGNVVLTASGKLDKGNHQAHK